MQLPDCVSQGTSRYYRRAPCLSFLQLPILVMAAVSGPQADVLLLLLVFRQPTCRWYSVVLPDYQIILREGLWDFLIFSSWLGFKEKEI